MNDEEIPVPPQWRPQPLYDFRHQVSGPRGYKVNVTKKGTLGSKRKLDEHQADVDRHEAAMPEHQGPVHEHGSNPPAAKRVKRNVVGVGTTSGREWKSPAQRASTLRNPKLSTSWERKMTKKAEAAAFKSLKQEAAAAHKEAKRQARQKWEEAKRRKEEAQKKAAITQKVSSETAKRMSKNKKLKKKLVVVDA